MDKSKDDQLLDIATELETTVKDGDFMKILERLVDRGVDAEKPKLMMTFSNLDTIAFYDSGAWKVGDRIEMMLSIPIHIVLQGRPVTPKEVVDLFKTSAGPSRSIVYEDIPGWDQFFRLTQRYTGDPELYDRINRVRDKAAKHKT